MMQILYCQLIHKGSYGSLNVHDWMCSVFTDLVKFGHLVDFLFLFFLISAVIGKITLLRIHDQILEKTILSYVFDYLIYVFLFI